MTGMLLLAVGGVLGGLLAILLLERLMGRADIGAALLLASAVIQAIFVDAIPSIYLPGGVRIEITDVFIGLIVVAGLARLARLPRLPAWQQRVLLLCALLLISLGRGMASFGLQTAVAEFREYIFFAGGALYLATFPPSSALWNRIGKLWLWFSIPLLLLVSARWLNVFAGIDLHVPAEKYGDDAAIRVVDGPYAFFLAHAFFLTVPMWLQGRRRGWVQWLSVILLVFVLLLNRRTVWLALLVGVAVIVLRDKRLGRKANMLVAGTAMAAVVTFFAFANDGGSSGSPTVGQSADAFGNFSWRVTGWVELLASWAREPVDWLLGQPFGTGFARMVDGSEVTAHPHNYYVETLLRTGVAGAVVLLLLTFGLLRTLWRGPVRDAGLLGPGVMPALLAMQLVWFLTWVPGVEQGIVTGIAVVMASAGLRERSGQPPRTTPTTQTPIPSKPVDERLLTVRRESDE
jgi:hypothetical protein